MAKHDPVAKFLGGRKARRLTAAEERQYAEKAHNGDQEALEILLCSQAHWIWTLCYKHPRPPSVDPNDLFEDMIAHAYLSFKNYDPSKSRLSSFLARVIPRKCSSYVVKFAGVFGKPIPKDLVDSDRTFLFNEDDVKAILAEPEESNVYEDEYHDDVDDLAEVVSSILAGMEPRSRWIVAKRAEGLTSQQIAQEETAMNIRNGIGGRPVEASNIMFVLHSVRREVFRELVRRDIPMDCAISGSRIGQLFDEANSDDQNRLFD